MSRVFEDFRYLREVGGADARDHVLVFQARIADKQIEGCDFLHADDNRSIDELVVMVRPLCAAITLAEAMKPRLSPTDGGPR